MEVGVSWRIEGPVDRNIDLKDPDKINYHDGRRQDCYQLMTGRRDYLVFSGMSRKPIVRASGDRYFLIVDFSICEISADGDLVWTCNIGMPALDVLGINRYCVAVLGEYAVFCITSGGAIERKKLFDLIVDVDVSEDGLKVFILEDGMKERNVVDAAEFFHGALSSF